MIPKQPTSSEDFGAMVNQIRQQFSSESGQTVSDIKDAFEMSSNEVVESVDEVRDTTAAGATKIVDNIVHNARMLETVLGSGRYGTKRLVDISYDMLDHTDMSTGLLRDIKDLTIGMSTRSGIWGNLRTWLKAFQPFTNERRQKLMTRQRIAANKLLRLTYMAQVETKDELVKNLIRLSNGGQEEKQERRNFMLRLLDKIGITNDPNRFTKRDKKWLSPKTFMQTVKYLMYGVLGLSAGALAAIILSMVTRYGGFGKALVAVNKAIVNWFTKSKLGITIGAMFLETIAKIGNLIDRVPVLKKTFTLIENMVKPITGFIKKIMPVVRFLGKTGSVIGKGLAFFVKIIKAGVKFLPFIGRAFATVGKFVPFLNIIIAAYEVVRGIMKGVEEIGGVKGAIVGLFGGILEFFTLGIFDMDAFLKKAKSAFAKFENGEFLAGIWELVQAPFVGIMSGLKWLQEKLFGGDLFKPNADAGLVGKVLFYAMTPWRLMFKGVTWLVDQFTSLWSNIEKLVTELYLLIDQPVATIKRWLSEPKRESTIDPRKTDENRAALYRKAIQMPGGATELNMLKAEYMRSGMGKDRAAMLAREKLALDMQERRQQQVQTQEIQGPPQPQQRQQPQQTPIILPSDTGYSSTESTFDIERMRFMR